MPDVAGLTGPTRLLFGLPLNAATMADTLGACEQALHERRRLLVGVLNAAKVVNLRRDALLRASLMECDLLLADGQSVVWASRLLGRPLPERVAGIDLFVALLDLADREGFSVYLLGAKPDVLRRLVAHVEERYPGLVIAGARDGYFKEEESAEVAYEIRASRPDMLFLGMTSPKKEIFLAAHGRDLGVPVLHGVGGSFDVLAGLTRRAPECWQRYGMEWAYRLLQEPRRMWRRYLRTNSIFLALVVRELLRPSPPLRGSL
ncbi:WecB/TagA/CpsF family glycosyltransferase [Georgenia thermotolerans]|uniref:WecB/TagA/CpsF family glycosyltransferase n=1 Tax=Georgenia thermotolerans TaxID=527326 RepID=A0A7J5UR34_9MICO|nr:WecB/TagA/CpsF family glycosyltransferase [Georgenia thermotolerans]KAE8764878.1 WecB/TagA/CpsF family glycosyltransferase [Georgenia thermotolerans]